MARGDRGGEQRDPFADLAGNGMPVDVAAVRRDDALIDAIVGDGPVATDSPEEYQVAALLANWRTEILAQPMPAEPDLDDIVARVSRELGAQEALTTRSRSGRNQLRLLRPVAAAAAVVAIAMGGMTVFSYNAEPGDPLWGITQVVFSEKANSTVAKIDTTSNLEDAERLIASGDAAGARAKLDSASARASAVNEARTRDQLNGWRERLLAELQKAVPPQVPSLPAGPPSNTPGGSTSGVPQTPAPQTGSPGTSVIPLPLTSATSVPVEPSAPVTTLPSPTQTPSPGDSGTESPGPTTSPPFTTTTSKLPSGSTGSTQQSTP
ncbi:hypothetical protein ERC79_05400 [Rhodococcus sp. ABRD24]|uniref:anti-sigma-D factor RsdA n=1 Tax=Rhodococcus sp. ABRD24 TaxID=2507582 RepID=UPI00103882B7|nr:anti-sigma-D factor RsdA [Rhodococcus sp. ABRD24]QBJ95457.1 hypothetical protein ERC79_05400 [Rhodococcus sp. ABRD24]